MYQLFIDWGTVIAFIILGSGIIVQTFRVKKRKSADDISLLEITARTGASVMLFFKNFQVGDKYLIYGQGIFVFIFLIYIITVARYRFFKQK